jgi:hypothetical protein
MPIDRLVGVNHADPRLPADVIEASIGTTGDDLAPGNTLTAAKVYTDAAIAAIDGGGGGGDGDDTVLVYVYTDEADTRPLATVVFWIPDPFNLPNPFGALAGDCVLRSTPNVIEGQNGLAHMWKGTAAELDALTPDPNTVYFVYEPEAL